MKYFGNEILKRWDKGEIVNLIRFYCIILHQMFLTHWYEIIYKLISDLSIYLTLYILHFVKYIFLNYFYFNAFKVSDHSERYPLNRCQINDLISHVLLHENWQFLNVVFLKTIVEFITKIISEIKSNVPLINPSWSLNQRLTTIFDLCLSLS